MQILLAVLTALFLMTGCAKNIEPFVYRDDNAGLIDFYPTTLRASCPNRFFKEEFSKINMRMYSRTQPDRPQPLIGLALSGGGIRSNAFQLGVMSALSDKGQMDNIAYISAVSGGTWAAAAFKADRNKASDFFKKLDDAVVDPVLASCESFSKYSGHDSKCQNPMLGILFNSYLEAYPEFKRGNKFSNPLGLYVGYSGREAWRGLLQQALPDGRDLPLNELEEENEKPFMKPFMIFNATHDAMNPTRGERNFPFEITGLGMGTIADCGNTDYCWGMDKKTAGVFLNYRTQDYVPFDLSHAMAISGDVFPGKLFGKKLDIFEWELPFPVSTSLSADGEPFHRTQYVLTDGGQSENLGALPLLERGVDLLIISDAAYDPDHNFGDYAILKSHAKNLLKKQLSIKKLSFRDTITDLHGNEFCDQDLLDNFYDESHGLIFRGHGLVKGKAYKNDVFNSAEIVNGKHVINACSDADFMKKNKKICEDNADKLQRDDTIYRKNGYLRNVERGGVYTGEIRDEINDIENRHPKTLLYLKLPDHIEDFMSYLKDYRGEKDKNYLHIYRYLLFNRESFPNSKTFAFSYDRAQIFAYYLLGKYMAENLLVPEIEKAMTQLKADARNIPVEWDKHCPLPAESLEETIGVRSRVKTMLSFRGCNSVMALAFPLSGVCTTYRMKI